MEKRNGISLLQDSESIQKEIGQIEKLVMDIGRLRELTGKLKIWPKQLLGLKRHWYSIKENLQKVIRPIGLCMNTRSRPILLLQAERVSMT